LGPPKLRWIGGCHARSSLRAPRTFHDATRTSRLVCRRRYSHIEGRRLLVGHGSAAASGPRERRRLPAHGHCRRSPSRSRSRCRRPGNRRLYFGSRNRRHRTYNGSPGLRLLKRARVGYEVWTAEPSTRVFNGDETHGMQDRRRRDAEPSTRVFNGDETHGMQDRRRRDAVGLKARR
jgi:hypothetical protein